MHHRVVEIRIELFAHSFDGFHAQTFQGGHQLLVDHLHPFRERIAFRRLRQPPFEVIHNGKDLLNDLSGSDHIHAGFFFFRTLTVVIKFSHAAFQPVCKFFNLLFQFVVLFLLTEERGFRLAFCLPIFLRRALLLFAGRFLLRRFLRLCGSIPGSVRAFFLHSVIPGNIFSRFLLHFRCVLVFF